MTNAELAILGLVLEAPRHGYEIEQIIEARGMRDWTDVGFSSIYYILNKLEERGLIDSRKEPAPGRGPTRKVFSITEKGRGEWYEATLEALSAPGLPSHSFLLGLVGLPAIPSEQAIPALRTYLGQLKKRRERLQNSWKAAGEPLPLYLNGLFDYGYRLVETEIEWLEEFIGNLAVDKGIES